MNNKDTEKKKNEEVGKKDLDRLSKDFTRKISSFGPSKSKRNNIFTLRVNPLILLVTAILLIFLFVSFLNRDIYLNKVSLDELISGIKDNQYSKVSIQDDGRVIANGKTYISYQGSSSDLNQQYQPDQVQKASPDDLIQNLSSTDVLSQLKAAFNRSSSSIDELIVGSDFVIAKRTPGTSDLLIENFNESDLKQKLADNNINLDNLGIKVSYLRSASLSVSKNSFNDRLKSYQIGTVWNLDGFVIAQINPDFVTKVYVDWTPSIYSFTDILQKEGISLSTSNVEITSVTVPVGVTLDQILTVITLVGFVILGYIIFRGAQSSGMGIMQFGQSKAKVFFGSKTDTTFKDVAGIDEAKDELNEIVDFLKNPNKYRKLGARIPKGVLMVGAPGTGKTLLARAIAGEAGVPFFHTSGSEFEEMLVGAGASRVRDLFSKAKKAAPSLIFIDEIDAVARRRGTRVQSGTTEQTLNQILVEMDGFEKNTNVIVLAATNRPDVLDPAILRPGRFDRQVRIEIPDMEGRKQILAIHGKNKPFGPDVDLEKIAKRTVGFTGADLENVLNEAAIIAAKDNKKEISMNDIEEAVSKVVLGPAKKSRKRTEKELNLVAYHEAGHAVVSKYTPNSTPVDKISIVSRGTSGGVTMFLPETDEMIMSRNKLVADITVSLGGRAAEEVALDDISTGASNDIEKATQVARRMVQKFGMSDKLGLVQYGESVEEEYLGYAYGGEGREFSDKTAESIDNEVREIIATAYENAKRILVENRDKLDRVAKELLDKEVLSKDEFEKLF